MSETPKRRTPRHTWFEMSRDLQERFPWMYSEECDLDASLSLSESEIKLPDHATEGFNYVVGYHGTNAQAAVSILAEGFRDGTYFAERLEDALRFGGPYLFAVVFEKAKFNESSTPEDRWQWRSEPVSPDKILWHGLLTLRGSDASLATLLNLDWDAAREAATVW